MSYILDALKKSDRERKRGDVPNLQTVHIPITVETQAPKLLYAFTSVLLLVLALVIGMMIAGGQADDSIVNTALSLQKLDKNNPQRMHAPLVVEPKTEQSIAPVITPTIVPISKTTVRPLIKKEVLQTQKISSVKVNESSKNQGVREKESEKKEPKKKEAEKKSEKVSRQLDLTHIPYLHEMPDYVQQSIPQMNFAGHVYSTNPQSRSVIINGAAMSEGDALVEGINVVEITVSGVVFSLQGELFRIDILQDWSFE